MNWLLRSDYALQPMDVTMTAIALCLAFLGGQLIAWTYMLTHSGLSYSRSFVNSLVLMPVLVSFTMMVMSNNLVTAFGMMAVFAIVRFRNILRDTLDTTYVLGCLVLGMASGTHRFSVAVLGLMVVLGIMIYLWMTSFGSRHRYDLIVNLHWARPLVDLPELSQLLDRHARRRHCASQRSGEGSAGADLSYRLLLRNTERVEDLITELRGLPGVSRVTSLKAEDESEV